MLILPCNLETSAGECGFCHCAREGFYTHSRTNIHSVFHRLLRQPEFEHHRGTSHTFRHAAAYASPSEISSVSERGWGLAASSKSIPRQHAEAIPHANNFIPPARLRENSPPCPVAPSAKEHCVRTLPSNDKYHHIFTCAEFCQAKYLPDHEIKQRISSSPRQNASHTLRRQALTHDRRATKYQIKSAL